jgi:hypothetical protein
VRTRDVPYSGHHSRQGQPEGQCDGQGIVGRTGRRAREDGADRNCCPAEDQDEGPHELGDRRAHEVRSVYLASIQAPAALLLLLLLLKRLPGAPTGGLAGGVLRDTLHAMLTRVPHSGGSSGHSA